MFLNEIPTLQELNILCILTRKGLLCVNTKADIQGFQYSRAIKHVIYKHSDKVLLIFLFFIDVSLL